MKLIKSTAISVNEYYSHKNKMLWKTVVFRIDSSDFSISEKMYNRSFGNQAIELDNQLVLAEKEGMMSLYNGVNVWQRYQQ